MIYLGRLYLRKFFGVKCFSTKTTHKMLEQFNFEKITPQIIEKKTELLNSKHRALFDSIGSLPLENVSYNNVIKVIDNIMRERITEGSPLDFPQHASPDKELRDASCKAEAKLEEFDVEMSMRKDVFDRIVAFKDGLGREDLPGEQKRFLEKLIRTGRRNGLHLPEETRNKLMDIKKRISQLSIKFDSNLNEDNTKLYFSKEELLGLPSDFINDLKEVDGKLEVTLKYPHLFPITKKCQVAQTRQRVTAASQAKCMKENTPILEELIELRHQHSQLLGYPTHAAYILEERMAKSPEKVASFLSDLSDKLDKLWKEELKVLNKLKKEECEKLKLENSGKLEFWDIKYYMNMVEETICGVDEEEIRQYFPLEKVTEGLFKIYEQLLGVKFHRISDQQAWHKDVQTYRVNDAASSDLLGYFFLDLHPREGKFGHVAVFPLQPSCLNAEGERQPAICAMMGNFTKPTKEKPALLDHSEVETYFHEFGHVMHSICSKANFSLFSGTKVESDFLEAPSQMLENWVWEKEPLLLLSGHHRTGAPLPDDLIEKLVATRKTNAGGINLRQIVLGTFDQHIHTRAKADTQQVFSDTYQKVMGITPIENTNMPASFGHISKGYDARYYGYLWSEVFAMDMFESRFKKEGILNPAVGMDYRNKVLRPGGSKDASAILRDFLGREPSHAAFLKSKGLAE